VPKGPRGEKRPADVIGAAVKVMRIATGEETEEVDFDGIDGGGNSAVEAALPSVQPRSSRGTSG
jgi:hypothetical protein